MRIQFSALDASLNRFAALRAEARASDNGYVQALLESAA